MHLARRELRQLGSGGVFREIFGDGEGGDGEDLFFAHDAHGFVAELVGVVDGLDTGAGGVERSGLAGGMHGDAVARAGGLADCGGQFFFGVLDMECRSLPFAS